MRKLLRTQLFSFLGCLLLVSVQLLLFFLPLFLIQLCKDINHLPAFVVAAVLTNRMRGGWLFAMGADAKPHRFQCMMRAHTVALPLGMTHSDYHKFMVPNAQRFCK